MFDCASAVVPVLSGKPLQGESVGVVSVDVRKSSLAIKLKRVCALLAALRIRNEMQANARQAAVPRQLSAGLAGGNLFTKCHSNINLDQE